MNGVLITPSYRQDFERCRLLCESVDRFAEAGLRHYVVVDRRDEAMFRTLRSSVVRIITVESVLPWWIFRTPGARRWWLSLRTMPIRNWILQQLVKLSMARVVDSDILAFVDSDVTFIRPFHLSQFVREGKLRFSRVSHQDEDHRRWLETAQQLLGLEGRPIAPVNYVGNFITWRRENVLKLHDHLAAVNGTHWLRAICHHWRFSEYTLYGMFVEHVLGLEAAGHYASDEPVLQLSWRYALDSEADVMRFLGDVQPCHMGIMVHSKSSIPVERYRRHVERLWQMNV